MLLNHDIVPGTSGFFVVVVRRPGFYFVKGSRVGRMLAKGIATDGTLVSHNDIPHRGGHSGEYLRQTIVVGVAVADE